MEMIKALLIGAVLVAASACSATGSNEQEIEHGKHHPAAVEASPKPVGGQDGMTNMMAGMQESMTKMQDTMRKIHASSSDAGRQKLLEEHMAQMQEHMKMMKEMDSGMGGMSGMKDKGDKHGMGMMDGGMKCGMMDRMDMMQQMMEQMMNHMAMQQSRGTK